MGIRVWVAVAALVAAVVVAPTNPDAATAASPAPQPVVVGNHLVDARTGALFTPRGANWPSFEYACWQGWGYSGSGATSAEAALMASWRINTVRIPLNQDCWVGLRGSPAGAGRTAEGYRAAVEAWVAKLNAVGIVAILDLHHSAPPGVSAHGQRAMPDSQSTAFWSSVAARFASNRSVMFDLFNEPYSRWASGAWAFTLTWSCWRDGGCTPPVEDDFTALGGETYSATGMSALVSSVRAAGATQPILLGGLDYANDLREWLAYRPADGQLVASWHNYPGQRCHTTTCWNTEIAAVAAVVPVVATEFGQTDGGSGYLTSFMTWAESKGIGYLPWAWWRVTEAESLTNSRYALVDGANQPKAPAGVALYNQLMSVPTSSPTPTPTASATPTASPTPTASATPTPTASPTPTPTPPPGPPTVTRIAGADRYATAVRVSRAAFPNGAPVVYIATGTGFADALAAGPAAAAHGGPVLLTTPTAVPASVRAEILRLDPDRIVVVGGVASVADSVLAALTSIQPATVRLAGADRYATARIVVDDAFGTVDEVYVATGRDFPDALSAGAAAARDGGALVLVNGLGTSLDAATRALLRSLDPDRIIIAGSSATISSSLKTTLQEFAPTTRVAGADRYATSLGLAQRSSSTAPRVLIATGAVFPDALAASAWAGMLDAPLLVTPGTCIPSATLKALTTFGTEKVTLIGGEPSLSPAVAALSSCG